MWLSPLCTKTQGVYFAAKISLPACLINPPSCLPVCLSVTLATHCENRNKCICKKYGPRSECLVPKYRMTSRFCYWSIFSCKRNILPYDAVGCRQNGF